MTSEAERVEEVAVPLPIIGDPMSDRAVYLGDGVWWQLTERQRRRGLGRGLPERIRPMCPWAHLLAKEGR